MLSFKKFFFHIALIIMIIQVFPSVYAQNKSNGGSSGNASKGISVTGTINCKGAFSKIYAFGGSYTDNGNAFLMGLLKPFFGFLNSMGSSDGGLCNGKMLIDYLAEAFGIPSPPPCKNASADFSSGANFALSGATVLPRTFFGDGFNIQSSLWKAIPLSIEMQMQWFNKFLQDATSEGAISGSASGSDGISGSGSISGGGGSSGSSSNSGGNSGSISGSGDSSSSGSGSGSIGGGSSGSSSSSGGISGGISGSSSGSGSISGSGGINGGSSTSQSCSANLMDDALFWIGSIGATDYGLIHGIMSFSDDWLANLSVNVTCNILKEVIDAGAKYIVVEGLPPIGCLPFMLSLTPSSDRDSYGCCASVNSAISKHNGLLQQQLNEFQKQYKNCVIVYADFAKAYLTILSHYGDFHFVEAFKACCGYGGNLLNFDLIHPCGSLFTTQCENAAANMVWDGIHFTSEVLGYIAQMFLSGSSGFTTPCLADVIKIKIGN